MPETLNDAVNTQDHGLQPIGKVARFLSLSRSKVYQMMEKGELRYVKFGKSRRIRWADVLKLVEANTIERE